MTYSVFVAPAAVRRLRKLDGSARRRIEGVIALLAQDPRPPSAVMLVGRANTWRVRTGDYRVIYEIDDGVLTVLVVAVGHRREVYRR